MSKFQWRGRLLLAMATTPLAALAADLPPPAPASAADTAPASVSNAVPGFGLAAPAGQLEQARGGDAGIASSATLGGVVSGNSATNVVTGANAITAGSFAGMAGIPIVIQNSGANVLIQNATIINLQFK